MEYSQYVDLPSFYDEDTDDQYLKRLSIYATVRDADFKAIIGKPSFSNRQNKKSFELSLQNLFSTTSPQVGFQNYAPDLQTPSIDEVEERSSSTEDVRDEEAEAAPLVVNGSDIQDLPVEYQIKGLRQYELPVIGFYIDRRICPGYRYKVRFAGSGDAIFDGVPRILQSVGMGYGKRLTFKGDKLNSNDFMFWSDNHPDGYAFSLVVLQKGDSFVLYNSMQQPVADVVVESADLPQIEDSMTAENGTVQKQVRVKFACSITYHSRHHGSLLEVNNQAAEVVEGVAEVLKPKREREARVTCIKNVYIQRVGNCTLWRE